MRVGILEAGRASAAERGPTRRGAACAWSRGACTVGAAAHRDVLGTTPARALSSRGLTLAVMESERGSGAW